MVYCNEFSNKLPLSVYFKRVVNFKEEQDDKATIKGDTANSIYFNFLLSSRHSKKSLIS